MASTNNVANTSENTASKIGDVARGIHGVGEQIRGAFNKGVDDVAGETFSNKAKVNDAKNRETIAKGEAEVNQGRAALNN